MPSSWTGRLDALRRAPHRFTNGPKWLVRGRLNLSIPARIRPRSSRLEGSPRAPARGVGLRSSPPSSGALATITCSEIRLGLHSRRRLTQFVRAKESAQSESVRNQAGSSSLERIPSFFGSARGSRVQRAASLRRMRRSPSNAPARSEFRAWGGARRGAEGSRPSAPRVSHRFRRRMPPRTRSTSRSASARTAEPAAEGNQECGLARSSGRSLRLDSTASSRTIHLIAEAEDRASLSRGTHCSFAWLESSTASGTGDPCSRTGPCEALRTPREVRTALVYVLQNARRHALRLLGIDPYSSGWWFDGWKEKLRILPLPALLPKSWLLREGWRRYGLIGLLECPSRERPRRGEA
jgi:hypothetical protein